MKNIKRIFALLLCAAVIMLCGCGAPAAGGTVDVSEALNEILEGSGLSVGNDGIDLTIKDGKVDLSASAAAIEKARKAMNNDSGAALAGVWHGEVDISGVIVAAFSSLDGLELENEIGGSLVPAVLTLTDSGVYTLRFDSSALSESETALLSGSVTAAKNYLADYTSGASKLIVKALDDRILETILQYVVNLADEMFSSGCGGTYRADGGSISFNSGESGCTYTLDGDTLTVNGGNMTGLLGLINGRSFTK